MRSGRGPGGPGPDDRRPYDLPPDDLPPDALDPGDRAARPSGRDLSLLLAVGLFLGLAADRLLWVGLVGPGLTLWLALLGGAAVYVARRAGAPRPGVVAGWAAVAVLAAAATAWRASPVLTLLLLLVVLVAASAVLLEARGHRLGRTGVLDHAWGLALVPWLGVVGALPLVAGASLPASTGRRRAAAVGRGVLLALPPLVVFGALFASADPAFERAVGRLIPDMADLPAHVFLVGFFGWVAAGLLGGVRPASRDNPLTLVRPPRLGGEEIGTVLGLVAALFVAFVAIQFSYLFGGAGAIESISGLTLAEYARRGFFELVAAAGLVLALLLVADSAAADDSTRSGLAGHPVLRALGAALLALVAAVIVSAGLRLRLYIAEFGLTVARFYAAAVMAWITISLGLLAATVLRGRPHRFASGALVAGIATVAVLVLVSPDARIARTNLDRAGEAPERVALDVAYLTELSGDAVPTLLAGLDRLEPHTRCQVARYLLDGWSGPGQPFEATDDWRGWNAATARARAEVEEARGELERACS